eukprot:gene122-182_t
MCYTFGRNNKILVKTGPYSKIMGSGASTVPDDVDLEQFQQLAGPRYRRSLFFKNANEAGKMTKEKLLELNEMTDVFLSHDWGVDELGRKNHDRVSIINAGLKARGLVTWFDHGIKTA